MRRITRSGLNLIGVVIVIYLGILLVRAVKHNYEYRQKITALEREMGNLQDERDELKYKIQYYQTDAYKERQARAKLGLQAPGENIIILPPQTAQKDQPANPKPTVPPKSNLEQWWEFLFG